MPLRTLIVDDDEDIRLLLELCVGVLEGVDIVGRAVDRRDAVEQVEVRRPNIVVMDLTMPKMDGARDDQASVPGRDVLGFTTIFPSGQSLLRRRAVAYASEGPGLQFSCSSWGRNRPNKAESSGKW